MEETAHATVEVALMAMAAAAGQPHALSAQRPLAGPLGQGGWVVSFRLSRRSMRGLSVYPRGPIRTRSDKMARSAGDALRTEAS
jgi:hypothetical protein